VKHIVAKIMARINSIALFATLVVFSTFYGADALACNVTNQGTTTIQTGCVACQKSVTFAANIAASTIRTCTQPGLTCQVQSGTTVLGVNFGTFVYCCTNIDYCNDAAPVSVNLGVAATAALGALWFLRR